MLHQLLFMKVTKKEAEKEKFGRLRFVFPEQIS